MDNTTINPFYTSGPIPDKYFCDREDESQWLVSSVTNGNNLVLISPRRMGKTSLIEHCYRDKSIKNRYYTFYIDILPTSCLAELVYMMSRCIYESLLPRGQKIINSFLSFVNSLRSTLGYDAVTGMPTFTISSGSVSDPYLTLDEIFRYIEQADKPCIFAIDEFQQIGKYPEKNVEALLRSYIQRCGNCKFIYAGSERHMMTRMFQDSARPFYNSASMLDLREIPRQVYTSFIESNFANCGRQIEPGVAGWIYDIVDGTTFYIQNICNQAFTLTPEGETCLRSTAERALEQLLAVNAPFFRERLSLVSSKQKPLLYAIAQDKVSEAILSVDFIKRHQLTSTSAIQNAARQLLDNGLLTLSEGKYSLSDKLLALWIRRNIL